MYVDNVSCKICPRNINKFTGLFGLSRQVPPAHRESKTVPEKSFQVQCKRKVTESEKTFSIYLELVALPRPVYRREALIVVLLLNLLPTYVACKTAQGLFNRTLKAAAVPTP